MAPLDMRDLMRIAEDAWAYRVPRSDEVREDAGDVVLVHRAGSFYLLGSANRIRFSPSSAERRIDEVRAWFGAQGRDAFSWWVGASATPGGLVERLLAGGAEPDPEDPLVTPMVLDHAPPPAPSGVEVRRVETFEDYRLSSEIMYEGFTASEQERSEGRARVAEDWEIERADDRRSHYVAWIGGEAVGMGMLSFLAPGPAYLVGGSTLPAARGRGAYRALVRARWDEAVRRGTPTLLVGAGQHSRPILERLGFRGGPPSHVLVDHSGRGQPKAS